LLGANAPLIGKAHSRARLSTPALVLDLDAFEHNLDTMANYCRVHRTTLRPHAKSHKSVHIAALQAKRGAVGICVATMREAQVMVAAGVRGVLITSPMVGEAKLDALVALLRRDGNVMFVVDSLAGVAAVESRLQRSRMTARVLIDVDVGMGRTGVPNLRDALRLARRVGASNRLELLGLQCYSGMVQHIEAYATRVRRYRAELALLEAILDGFKREGLQSKIVTGGGTGTFDIDRKRGLFTECQAGSYVFMDVQYNEVELVGKAPRPFRTSLFVQSMVLSRNHPGSATVDAGFKSFAMDGPVPLVQSGAPGDAIFQFYGDEFGKLTWSGKSKRVPLAKKVEFVTPHCDPTVNLHNVYHCVRGNRLVDIWPVDARGAL
jgi:D-serine deaminase-like pyridoxal phosphate-dependent protein